MCVEGDQQDQRRPVNPVLKPYDVENEDLPCAQGKTVKRKTHANRSMFAGIDTSVDECDVSWSGLPGETD